MGEDIGCTVNDDDVTLSLPEHFRADLPIKIATHGFMATKLLGAVTVVEG